MWLRNIVDCITVNRKRPLFWYIKVIFVASLFLLNANVIWATSQQQAKQSTNWWVTKGWVNKQTPSKDVHLSARQKTQQHRPVLANQRKQLQPYALSTTASKSSSTSNRSLLKEFQEKFSSKLSHSSSKDLKSINPTVLRLAVKAHQKAQRMGLAKKSLVTIIDYSLPSTQPRLWVIDMAKNKVIYHTHVAHGSGSGDNQARKFSDVPGSYQSSLGVFVTGKTYQGKHGLSLTLHGLEQGINGNAERRKIVVHGADYVNPGIIQRLGRLGRSWGCPALDYKMSTPIIQAIKEGSLVFAYYPDDKWLKRSKFL